jgi:hypothetical protein
MLTVLHVLPSKHESLIQTPYVGAEPVSERSDNIKKVWIERPDGGRHALENGTVFVMNDNGKTVARYYLGGWADPQDEGCELSNAVRNQNAVPVPTA